MYMYMYSYLYRYVYMDMFMYNCDYVIRHLSLLNHTVVLYDCKEIRNDLKISIEDLRNNIYEIPRYDCNEIPKIFNIRFSRPVI